MTDLMTPPATKGPGGRAKIQAFGAFLTAMVIPNVGAFIAWGLLTALFIPTGWLPNEELAQVVGPMIIYLLPTMLAYSGGRLVHGHRGGVAGAVGAFGLIVGASTGDDKLPMFLGAMIMGPLSAWLIKKVDDALDGRIRSGFEMVVNNFTLGILGLGLIIATYEAIGPAIQSINNALSNAIQALVDTGALPLLSVLNEPAKVLFLNNAIDQGIYYPLGLQAAADDGKSIFFMVASNPGPGLGLLIAFWLFGGNRIIRDSAPGAIIIHFFGGIHEIYFPYVLMKPITILAMIAGGMSGIATFMAFGVGLTAGPSPGSIFSYLALTPRGNFLGVIAGVLVAAAVSFAVTSVILLWERRRNGGMDDDLEQHADRSRRMKQEGKDVFAGTTGTPSSGDASSVDDARSIVFACDAGMGSSAMGASSFRKRLVADGRDDVAVTHAAIESIPAGTDLVVVHKNLADRARAARPGVPLVTIDNFLGDPSLDDLAARLTSRSTADAD